MDSLGDAGISLFDKRDVSLSVSPRVNTLYKLFHTLYGKEMEEMGEVSGSFIVCRLLGWLLALFWFGMLLFKIFVLDLTVIIMCYHQHII